MEARAKIFQNGRSQAVRLPKAFRLKGTEVKISKDGDKIVLEPLKNNSWPDGFWDIFSKDSDFEIPKALPAKVFDLDQSKGNMYLLDTNIISYWMRGDDRIIAKLKQHAPSELSMSAITLAEILYGIEKSPNKKEERREKLKQIALLLKLYPFDEKAAEKYAVIRSQLEREGNVISERDLQIASIAMANNFIVVTHNIKEFQRILKLKVDDWYKN